MLHVAGRPATSLHSMDEWAAVVRVTEINSNARAIIYFLHIHINRINETERIRNTAVVGINPAVGTIPGHVARVIN